MTKGFITVMSSNHRLPSTPHPRSPITPIKFMQTVAKIHSPPSRKSLPLKIYEHEDRGEKWTPFFRHIPGIRRIFNVISKLAYDRAGSLCAYVSVFTSIKGNASFKCHETLFLLIHNRLFVLGIKNYSCFISTSRKKKHFSTCTVRFFMRKCIFYQGW